MRDAIDRYVPATTDERSSALQRLLGAAPMEVPAPAGLRAELEELRGRRA